MTKDELRAELLERRRSMTADARSEAADAIALHLLAAPIVSGATRVACYLSMTSEPGTAALIEGLIARGTEVVVPVSLADGGLDWAAYDPATAVKSTALGIFEPTGPRLGANALVSCALVIVPALAVDHAGQRLGRGAGYYDRALAGVAAPLCALLFAHELLPALPHEPHDIPVQMAVTPQGLFRVP